MADILYKVNEVAELIKTNNNYVYALINEGYLPALKLGSLKVRKSSLDKFLEEYEGFDLTDLGNIRKLDVEMKE